MTITRSSAATTHHVASNNARSIAPKKCITELPTALLNMIFSYYELLNDKEDASKFSPVCRRFQNVIHSLKNDQADLRIRALYFSANVSPQFPGRNEELEMIQSSLDILYRTPPLKVDAHFDAMRRFIYENRKQIPDYYYAYSNGDNKIRSRLLDLKNETQSYLDKKGLSKVLIMDEVWNQSMRIMTTCYKIQKGHHADIQTVLGMQGALESHIPTKLEIAQGMALHEKCSSLDTYDPLHEFHFLMEQIIESSKPLSQDLTDAFNLLNDVDYGAVIEPWRHVKMGKLEESEAANFFMKLLSHIQLRCKKYKKVSRDLFGEYLISAYPTLALMLYVKFPDLHQDYLTRQIFKTLTGITAREDSDHTAMYQDLIGTACRVQGLEFAFDFALFALENPSPHYAVMIQSALKALSKEDARRFKPYHDLYLKRHAA